jgi:cytoskeletal protein CcmA (bactofilin family)
MIFSKTKSKAVNSPREDAKAGMFSEKIEADSIKRWRSFAGDTSRGANEEPETEESEQLSIERQSTVMLAEEDAILPQATARWRATSGEMTSLSTPQLVEEPPVEEKIGSVKPRQPQAMTPSMPQNQMGEKPRSDQNLVSDLSLSVEEDLKRRFGGNIRSALGTGTVIEGTFRFDSPVRIDGSLKGEVSSSSVLIVGEEACVEANIEVGSLIVLGNVEGTIEANELIEIRGEGKLEGSIFTKRLVIDDGATFNGSCRIIR